MRLQIEGQLRVFADIFIQLLHQLAEVGSIKAFQCLFLLRHAELLDQQRQTYADGCADHRPGKTADRKSDDAPGKPGERINHHLCDFAFAQLAVVVENKVVDQPADGHTEQRSDDRTRHAADGETGCTRAERDQPGHGFFGDVFCGQIAPVEKDVIHVELDDFHKLLQPIRQLVVFYGTEIRRLNLIVGAPRAAVICQLVDRIEGRQLLGRRFCCASDAFNRFLLPVQIFRLIGCGLRRRAEKERYDRRHSGDDAGQHVQQLGKRRNHSVQDGLHRRQKRTFQLRHFCRQLIVRFDHAAEPVPERGQRPGSHREDQHLLRQLGKPALEPVHRVCRAFHLLTHRRACAGRLLNLIRQCLRGPLALVQRLRLMRDVGCHLALLRLQPRDHRLFLREAPLLPVQLSGLIPQFVAHLLALRRREVFRPQVSLRLCDFGLQKFDGLSRFFCFYGRGLQLLGDGVSRGLLRVYFFLQAFYTGFQPFQFGPCLFGIDICFDDDFAVCHGHTPSCLNSAASAAE